MKKRYKKQNLHMRRLIMSLIVLVGLVSLIYLTVSEKYFLPCANTRNCKETLTFKIDNTSQAVFLNQLVDAPSIDLDQEIQEEVVLGADVESIEKAQNKHIYINLETQTLSAYDGDELFMETPVSTGLWGKTPTGEFDIWVKLRSTTMSGGSGDDYYNLPNVPYVMFFSNQEVAASRGFGIHGTYWHNNFGHPMSHGCINMRTIDVAKLYEWATPVSSGHTTHSSADNPGTKLTIHDGSLTL
ncbi:MAG: L,D-transpeptidase [bacterium]|nr:L,D-transpeptidase [bacterium]